MNEVDGDELVCPFCGSPGQLTPSGNSFTCQTCGHGGKLSGHLCPDCSTYSEEDRLSCVQCSEILIRTCTRCGRANWSGYHDCHYCGNSLSIIHTLAGRHSRTATSDRLESQMRQSKVLKLMEDAASTNRMQEFESIEKSRRAHVKEEERLRRRRDRQLLITAAAVFIVFIIFLIAYGVFAK